MDEAIFEKMPKALLPWYQSCHRALPWRESKDPYRVWVSEIMLQQTRVETVKGYYARFLRALPTVADLATCDDDSLAKLWEGLGYYSRVRNMKKAAQCIVTEFDGSFPREYEKVLSLPGIGEYTAGAICSICFDQPTPAVDGNVLRVVARLTEDTTPIDRPSLKQTVRKLLSEHYPAEAGAYTQALMELGATVCGPNRKPVCEECPCRGFCGGYASGSPEKLPVKSPRKKRREEAYTLFIMRCENRYALEKRQNTGLLASLWQFPNVPGLQEPEKALETIRCMGLRPTGISRVLERKHIFTHVQWNMRGVYVEVAEPGGGFCWRTAEEITAEAALPTAFRQFWEEVFHV